MEGVKLLPAHNCVCRFGVLRMRSIVLIVVSYVVATTSCSVPMQCTAAELISSSLLQEHRRTDVDGMSRPAAVTDDRLHLKNRDTRPEDVGSHDHHDDQEDRLITNIMNTDLIRKGESRSGGIADEMKSESVSFRPGWRPVRVQFNVLKFGALGDGTHNDTNVCHALSLYIAV